MRGTFSRCNSRPIDAHAPARKLQIRAQRRGRDARRDFSRRRNQHHSHAGRSSTANISQGITSIGNFNRPPQRRANSPGAGCRREPRDLQPSRRRAGTQLAGKKPLLGFVAPQFSARSFRNRIRRDDFDHVGRQADHGGDLRRDGLRDPRARGRFAFARFRDDHQPLGARLRDSAAPNATTQPLRTPGTCATASSIS